MNKLISALFAGLLFGIGLAASGMTNPDKVIGFLDIFGQWDPDLLFVMGSAVMTTVISFHFILKRSSPVFTSLFDFSSNVNIDKPLITGAVLFGIGWGMFGYCPGPAVAALAYMQPLTIIFVISLLVGLSIGNRLSENSKHS